jgi:transcription elongation factor GreA
MHDELTEVDIQKMQEEIDYRETELRPKLIEDVQTARGFGDLSENFEYKAAKQAKNKNESRIRYLKRMIASAVVISAQSQADEVGLFDRVTLFAEDEAEEEIITLVTTLRQNPMKGLISKESPVGQALLGHKVGDRVFIQIGQSGGYWAQVRAIEKGVDDDTMEISKY